jgi:glycosyltransferase involved in cell wall biosynthesis
MNVLVVCRMPDSNLESRLEALLHTGMIDHIYLLRAVPYKLSTDRISLIGYRINKWIPNAHLRRFMDGLIFLSRNKVGFIFSIHVHPHGYIGWALSRIFRLPFVMNVIASNREFSAYGRIMYAINRLLLKTRMSFAVTGSSTIGYLESFSIPRERIFFLPSAINPKRFDMQNKEKSHDLLMVARLDENKNGYVLFRALRRLADRGLYFTLRIAGHGVSAEKYRAAVHELQLDNQVTFLGQVSSPIVHDLLLTSRVFVLPSRGEGFPMSLLEAMACGVPPICTPVGDILDVLQPGVNGLVLTDPDDDQQLAGHIETMLTQPDLYQKFRSNAIKIREERDFGSVALKWREMIENVAVVKRNPS